MASERIQRQIDRLLDEAEQAITSEDWPTVASRVRSVLSIEPENGDAKAYLAVVERVIESTADPFSPQSEAEPPPQSTSTSDAERRDWGLDFSGANGLEACVKSTPPDVERRKISWPPN